MASQKTATGRTQRSVFIDDDKFARIRREAFERECSVADVVNELLGKALAARGTAGEARAGK